ncbi:MAG: dihydropteroate synthase [Acidobacteriota bacterium]
MTKPRHPAWSAPLPGCGETLRLTTDRPKVMGVLNITPDSFSDGGLFHSDVPAAVARGLRMVEEGAEILDLGAESTRPGGGVYGEGCAEVSAELELERLLPVLKALRRELPKVALSIDTRKGSVARRALEHGADLINDVGGLRDPELVTAAADAGCPVVAMHSRGELATMQRQVAFEDVLAEVAAELGECLERAERGGVPIGRVVLDPGIGFGKETAHNLSLIGGLDRLHDLGTPLLLGASRKSFIAAVSPAPPDRRLGGSLAAVAWAARTGAAIVRVHDVEPTVQFLKVFYAIDSARS